MKTKLNGWQRLWVVLSVLYLAVVIIVSVNLWPNSQGIEKDFFNKVYSLIDEDNGNKIRLLSIDRDTSTAKVETPDGRIANFQIPNGASEIEIMKFATEWWEGSADKKAKSKNPKKESGPWEKYADKEKKWKLVPVEGNIFDPFDHKKYFDPTITTALKSDLVSEANRRGLFQTPKNRKEELLLAEDWLSLAKLAVKKHNQEIDFSEVKSSYGVEKTRVNKERKELVLGALLFWIIPIGVLYLLGMSVGWVFRGFKT